MSTVLSSARNLPKKTMAILVLAVLGFWFIDIPWTVRGKVFILGVLPLDAKFVDEMTVSLCKNSYGKDWSVCYSANRDENYQKQMTARWQVQLMCNSFREPNRKDGEFACTPNDDLTSSHSEICVYLGAKQWDMDKGKVTLLSVTFYEDGCTMVFDDFKTVLSDCGGRSCPR